MQLQMNGFVCLRQRNGEGGGGARGESTKDRDEPRSFWEEKRGADPTKHMLNKETAFNIMCYWQWVKPYTNTEEKRPQK